MTSNVRLWTGWIVLPLAALATVAVYWGALRGPFLMDDFDAIFPLAQAQASGMGWWDTLANAPSHIRMRLVANATFLLNQLANGGAMPPAPFGYKLGNLMVHLGCGALVYLLAMQLQRRWRGSSAPAWPAAALAAGLFLLHPLLLSTVLYPVQRMAQLSTLFVLLAVLGYIDWRRHLATRTALRSHLGIAAVLVAMALAFLSKENGALAPLLVLVVELTAFTWPARGSVERTRFETGFGLLCAGPLVLGAVLLALRWQAIVDGYAVREFTLPERLLTQLHVLAGYLGQIAWPRIGGMGLFHDDEPIRSSLDAGTALLGAAFLGAALAALLLRRRAPALAFGVLWFLASHAMESSVIALELVYEHRNYLALPGLAIALAALCGRLPRPALLLLGVAMLAALGTQTWRRAQQWSGYGTWLAAEAEHHPHSLRAGAEWFLYQVERGEDADAAEVRDRMQAMHPDHAQPVLLKLAFACPGPIPVPTLTPADVDALRTLRIGKDAFHLFVGMRDSRNLSRCAQPDWGAFGAAAEAVAGNPHLDAHVPARAAWWRLAADARQRIGNWPGVREATLRALQLAQNDPRDWLRLMRASIELDDAQTYQRARQQLVALMGQRLGPLAEEVQALDMRADGLVP